MKVVITGGAGFIGSHVADILAAHNNNIIIIDDLSTGKIENISFLSGNHRDRDYEKQHWQNIFVYLIKW